jgi:hypothetical protein
VGFKPGISSAAKHPYGRASARPPRRSLLCPRKTIPCRYPRRSKWSDKPASTAISSSTCVRGTMRALAEWLHILALRSSEVAYGLAATGFLRNLEPIRPRSILIFLPRPTVGAQR